MYEESTVSQYRVMKMLELILHSYADYKEGYVNKEQLIESTFSLIGYLYDEIKQNQWSGKTEWNESGE